MPLRHFKTMVIFSDVSMKKILQIALIVLFALVFSSLSMFIKTGIDTTESKTIGTISNWGFPIHYRSTAPGWTWAQFDILRFCLNSIVWVAVLSSIMIMVTYRKNRNKPMGRNINV